MKENCRIRLVLNADQAQGKQFHSLGLPLLSLAVQEYILRKSDLIQHRRDANYIPIVHPVMYCSDAILTFG